MQKNEVSETAIQAAENETFGPAKHYASFLSDPLKNENVDNLVAEELSKEGKTISPNALKNVDPKSV